MYCHQYFFGGKYNLIQLHRQIIFLNDGISMKNWLKSWPSAFLSTSKRQHSGLYRSFFPLFTKFLHFSPINSILSILLKDNNILPFYISFFHFFPNNYTFPKNFSILSILPTDKNTLPFYRSFFPLFPKSSSYNPHLALTGQKPFRACLFKI